MPGGRNVPGGVAYQGRAEGGAEDGHELVGHSIIVNPQGKIVAMADTRGDQVVTSEADLDLRRVKCTTIFRLAAHWVPEHHEWIA